MVLGVRNSTIHSSYVPDPEIHYSIDFDGVNDYASFGNIGTVKMLSFWFSSDTGITSASSVQRLMHWYDISTSVYFGIHLGSATGVLTNETLTLMIDAQNRVGAINYAITAGQWYHVFASFHPTNNEWNLYINGVNVGVAGSGDGSAQTLLDFTDFEWGSDGGTSGRFNGKMTDVATWDTSYVSLTEQMIATTLYNGGVPHDPRIASGNYGPPIIAQLTHYWRVNEGSNTAIFDLVGSSDGVTTSTPPWSTSSPYN